MRAKILILLEDINEDVAHELADYLRGHKDVITRNQDNVVLEIDIPYDDKDFEYLKQLQYNMGYHIDSDDCEHQAFVIHSYNPLNIECVYCGDARAHLETS